MHREPRFFRALAPYLGGKRRLCPLIFSLLRERLPESAWRSSSFLDPFCGGGAVSLYAKAQGSDVVASDPATRAAAVARALVANASVRLRREDVLDLYRAPLGDYPRAAAEHVPGVFTAEQAAWLDRAVAVACMRAEPVRSLLLLVAIKAALSFQPMSMLTASDAAAAACCDFDRVSPRRLGHYLRAREKLAPDRIWRLAERVNAGVFGGRGSARQGDACSVIAETAPDVLYLDPPYAGTTRYDREYAVLDELLRDAAPEHPPPSLDELLAAAHDIPLLVLSYGGPTASLDRLTATVARHRTVLRALAVPYPHLRSIATNICVLSLPRRRTMVIANSSSSPAADERLVRVPLDRLHAHPANPNLMNEERLETLARNIEREGRYPPLVARPHPERPDEWQLLDGHQRADVLRRLGHSEAVIFPWPCDDEMALMLLATLNRLEGEDVPARRAELLAELTALTPADELAELLPEDAAAIEATLALLDFDTDALLAELSAAAASAADGSPRMLSFAVDAEDEAAIERALEAASADMDGKNRRGRALGAICRSYLEIRDG